MINIQTSNLNQPLFKQNIIANWFKKILETTMLSYISERNTILKKIFVLVNFHQLFC